MAISECPSMSFPLLNQETSAGTGSPFREPVVGTLAFPLAVYDDNVGKHIVFWHWHEEFEIGCVTEGAVLVETGRHKHILYPGDIYFVNSDVMHAMRNAEPGSPAGFKALVFHGSIIGGKENSVFHQKYVLPVMKNLQLADFIFRGNDGQTDRLFSEIIRLWSAVCEEESGYELLARNTLSAFFRTLLTLSAASPVSVSVPGDGQRQESRAKVMLDYIHGHYSDAVTLEEIADAAAVSVSEALRCFKRIIGISPIQYLKRYRLQMAANFIKSGEYSIRQICDFCGFADSSYFSKSFKEMYCCTPSDYINR